MFLFKFRTTRQGTIHKVRRKTIIIYRHRFVRTYFMNDDYQVYDISCEANGVSYGFGTARDGRDLSVQTSDAKNESGVENSIE